MAYVAQQGDAGFGILGGARKKPHQGPHLLGIMDEEVDISGRPVTEIGPGESRSASQVAGDPRLAGTDEVEDKVRDDPAVEGLTHRLPGSGAAAAIQGAGASAAR